MLLDLVEAGTSEFDREFPFCARGDLKVALQKTDRRLRVPAMLAADIEERTRRARRTMSWILVAFHSSQLACESLIDTRYKIKIREMEVLVNESRAKSGAAAENKKPRKDLTRSFTWLPGTPRSSHCYGTCSHTSTTPLYLISPSFSFFMASVIPSVVMGKFSITGRTPCLAANASMALIDCG